MRLAVAVLLGCVCTVGAQSKLNVRYGIEYDGLTYPQATAKQGLASVLKALDGKRLDYLLGQLTEPEFVDQRVQERHAGNFKEFVKEVSAKLVNDPDTLKMLHRFLRDGKWEGNDTTASAKLDDVKERVFFRKVEGRWFFEDRKKTEPEKEPKPEKGDK